MSGVPTGVVTEVAQQMGIARHAVESPDPVDLSDDVLAGNDHRATRHGLETRVVDVDQTMRPLREIAVRPPSWPTS